MLGWEFPPYFAGGVGTVCGALTQALSKRNVEVTYIMPSGPRNVHADFVNLLVADNMIADGEAFVRQSIGDKLGIEMGSDRISSVKISNLNRTGIDELQDSVTKSFFMAFEIEKVIYGELS